MDSATLRRATVAAWCAVVIGLVPAIVHGQPPDSDGDGLPDAWELQFGLDPASAAGVHGASGDPDGDGIPNAAELAAGTHPRGLFTKSFAEGATGPFFDLRLALFNPSPSTAARVLVRFMTSEAVTVSQFLLVAPLARVSLDPETIGGLEATALSTVVESDLLVVADRTMWWDRDRYGSHAETGVDGPALVWFLAEGATHSGFDLFYLLQNPNAVEAAVTVTYLLPSGAPLVRTYSVAARSRFNIWVDHEDPALASTDVSASITSSVPIVVERAMYLNVPGQLFGAGHASAGVTSPATEWYLAEGATGQLFDLFILLANPTDQDAAVTARYLLPDGSTLERSYVVRRRSRFTIWVDHEDPRLADTAVSTTVTSTNRVPVIVERAMWWPGSTWHEAHNSAGATRTAAAWALAEGEVGGPTATQTYVLVANTGASASPVEVTVHFEDGEAATRTFQVAGHSRFTVDVGTEFAESFRGASSRRFATVVRSTTSPPAPLIVERAMYSDARGTWWAAGTNALATPLAASPGDPGDPGGSSGLPVISIAATDPEAHEQGIDRAVFTVTRSSGEGTLVVPILVGGTAGAGDYGPLPTEVVFAPSSTTALIVVTPTDDAEIEPIETVVVTLAGAPGYRVGHATARIVITDNDKAGASAPALDDAVRFLRQATFGPTVAEVERLRQIGFEAWITEQVAAPRSGFLGYLDAAAAAGETIGQNHLQEAWFQAATVGPDQLRQRVANALLEILVVSSTNGLEGNPVALAGYMDLLMRNAFGNFRTLIHEVSLSPAMGRYLDHLQNQKEDPRTGRNPNENFARELLQLFTIGTYRLRPDGTPERDARSELIPTYGQDEVIGFSRVFTGWTFNQRPPYTNFYPPADWRNPMVPVESRHSTSGKLLLDGEYIPPSQTSNAANDVRIALDNIFHHPNVGPFICRQLIQRLVTSNPTPAYVARVAAVFADNGQGVRGDLLAVVRAILLDPEARDPHVARNPYYGHLSEPMIRFVSVLRAFNGRAASGKFRVWSLQNDTAQAPFRSPSVFNFFSPDYARPGEIADAGLVSPEFEIVSETTAIRTANLMRNLVYRGYGATGEHQIVLDFSAEQALATDPQRLLDRLDWLLFARGLSTEVRDIVLQAVTPIPASRPLDRVRMAVYLLVTAPEYVVQK